MKSLKVQISEYRAERSLTGGYVVISGDEIAGWAAALFNPSGWMPGCIAIDKDGKKWIAKGGNDYDGAERWEEL